MASVNYHCLVLRAQQGDRVATERILSEASKLARYYANTFFASGYEPEDLYQEAMIGAYKAIHIYNPAAGKWNTIVRTCMQRNIYNIITESKRKKAEFFQDAAKREVTEETYSPLDLEEAIEIKDLLRRFFSANGDLGFSDVEKECFFLAIQGFSIREISKFNGRPYKSVDNALNRARKKVIEWKQKNS